MARAEQPDVPDRGLASESHLEIVVELEPVLFTAQLSVSHRPGTACLIALPDRALDGGRDVAGRLRLRAWPVFRLPRPVGQRLALSISLQDQLEGFAHDLLE